MKTNTHHNHTPICNRLYFCVFVIFCTFVKFVNTLSFVLPNLILCIFCIEDTHSSLMDPSQASELPYHGAELLSNVTNCMECDNDMLWGWLVISNLVVLVLAGVVIWKDRHAILPLIRSCLHSLNSFINRDRYEVKETMNGITFKKVGGSNIDDDDGHEKMTELESSFDDLEQGNTAESSKPKPMTNLNGSTKKEDFTIEEDDHFD